MKPHYLALWRLRDVLTVLRKFGTAAVATPTGGRFIKISGGKA
jgi:hypothetical protein